MCLSSATTSRNSVLLTNVLVKAGFEPLAYPLLEFRPSDFCKADSGSFMAITVINHTVATLIRQNANPG